MVEAVNDEITLRIGDLIFAAALVPNIIFLAVYVFKAPWFRDPIGRMFVFAQASLIVVSVVVLASLIFGPDYPGRGAIRIAGYSMHFVAQWTVLFTYLRERAHPTGKLPLIPLEKHDGV